MRRLQSVCGSRAHGLKQGSAPGCHRPVSVLFRRRGFNSDRSIVGVGLDCSSWVDAGKITPEEMQDRNWVFWTTFCQVSLIPDRRRPECPSLFPYQDTTWSLYVGRDFCVSSFSESQNIPVPFVDGELDQRPWNWPNKENPPQPNYLSRIFHATCQLLQIARRIMSIVSVTLSASRGRGFT